MYEIFRGIFIELSGIVVISLSLNFSRTLTSLVAVDSLDDCPGMIVSIAGVIVLVIITITGGYSFRVLLLLLLQRVSSLRQ